MIFTGFQEDIGSYYDALDAIVICAKNEALGRITIEGMLSHKPVIGKISGATPELIKDGVTGLLYDTPKKLSQSIEYLFENPTISAKLAKNGAEYAVTNFSSCKSIDKLYKEINRLT